MVETLAKLAEKPIAFIDLQEQRRRIEEPVRRAIDAVLLHGQFVSGPEVRLLEQRLAAHCGAAHAIGCSSGTDALVLALMALGAGPGDAVFVPSFTFAATAEAVVLVGATPVFVDCLMDTCNIDAESLAAAIEMVCKDGTLRPVGIIPVGLFGQPADFARIDSVAAKHSLWTIDDAAQSYGSAFRNRRVGTLATVTTTSFFPAKPLGCYGDGGAVFTEDAELARVVRSLVVHGQGSDKYDNVRIGMNGRLDTIQAAVLLEKLNIFDNEVELRDRVAARYSNALRGIVEVPTVLPEATSVWAQYTVALDGRDGLAASLKAAGIPTAIYYPRPLHRQTAYRHFPVAPGGLPASDALSHRVLSLPMHPYLDATTQDRIVDAVRGAMR